MIWHSGWTVPLDCAYSAVKQMNPSQMKGWISTTGHTAPCWDTVMNANRYTWNPSDCFTTWTEHGDFKYDFFSSSQVVEIASVTEHLLGECGSRAKFRQCVRCSEAVLAEDMPRHIQDPTCNRESWRKSHKIGWKNGRFPLCLSETI